MKKLIGGIIAAAVIFFVASALTVDYEAGVYTSSKYESDFLDYSFTLPSGYRFMSTEQLAAQMGINTSKYGENVIALRKEIAKKETIYDMMAYNTKTGSNIIVAIIRKPTIGQSLSGLAEEMIEKLPDYIEGGAVTDPNYEMTEIMGRTAVKFKVDMDVDGTNLNCDFYAFKEDLYLGCVLISYADGYQGDASTMKSKLKALP